MRDLPGNWTKPQVQVYAMKNLDIQSWVDSITSLLSKAIFEPLGKKEAAANKWWTIASTLENQGLGQLLHDILPRVVTKARVGQHDQDHLDEQARANPNLWYTAFSGAKAKQSFEFLNDQPFSKHTCACLLVHCEPLDHLSNRMQHLDAKQTSVQEQKQSDRGTWQETLKDGGLLDECVKHLWYNMCLPEDGVIPPARSVWPKATLFDYFRGGSWFSDFVESYHRSGMKLGAQMWAP